MLLCATGRRPSRSDGGQIHARARLPRPKSFLQVLCLPTAPVLPIVRNRDFGRSRFWTSLDFMGSFSDKNCFPRTLYGYANFVGNRGAARFGSISFNTMILQPYMGRSLSLRRLKEPNATADRYIDGRGMSFGLEDQKPQLKPPSSPLGLFFLSGWRRCAAVAIGFKSSCSK